MMMRQATLAVALILAAPNCARAEEVQLSCRGTSELIPTGKPDNPPDEKPSSIAIAVDLAKKTINVDGVKWLITGDRSNDVIVSMDPGKGTVMLNRITGTVNVRSIESTGTKKFYGDCKLTRKLF
jgi:hypothetical protein